MGGPVGFARTPTRGAHRVRESVDVGHEPSGPLDLSLPDHPEQQVQRNEKQDETPQYSANDSHPWKREVQGNVDELGHHEEQDDDPDGDGAEHDDGLHDAPHAGEHDSR